LIVQNSSVPVICASNNILVRVSSIIVPIARTGAADKRVTIIKAEQMNLVLPQNLLFSSTMWLFYCRLGGRRCKIHLEVRCLIADQLIDVVSFGFSTRVSLWKCITRIIYFITAFTKQKSRP
jgi:hypothetical protein